MVHLGTATRVCFVKFKDPSSVHVAQHLTNTVFIDRALIVVPVQDGEFIEREYQNIVFEVLTLPPHPYPYQQMKGASHPSHFFYDCAC